MRKALRITILVDNPDSWILPYAKQIQEALAELHYVKLCLSSWDIPEGDILFLLGCTSMVRGEILKRNKNNLVVHESDLPSGRGWSPVAWQVLEGKSLIPIVLFEATEEMDAGPIYLQDFMALDGSELLGEIRRKQAEKTAELVRRFVELWPEIQGKRQIGDPTYYARRRSIDDALDPRKSIIENFNHLRIVDNEKYPAWFEHLGRKYKIKIYSYDE
ncbi:MAG: formyltransferase family protein [Syntrophales bacterium]|jgi:methionyl-tRNA formyltransferase